MWRAEPVKLGVTKGIQRKPVQPPFGIYRLAGYLEQEFRDQIALNNLEIIIADPALAAVCGTQSELLEELISGGPYDVVGFSPVRVLLGEDLQWVSDLTNQLLAAHPAPHQRPLFLCGGQEASMNWAVLFEVFPQLDGCVAGVGEFPLATLTRRLLEQPRRGTAPPGGLASGIAGLMLRPAPGLPPPSGPSPSAPPHAVGDIEQTLLADADHATDCNFSAAAGSPAPSEGPQPAKITSHDFRRIASYAGGPIPYSAYWRHAEWCTPPHLPFTHVVRLYGAAFCPHRCGFCSAQRFGWSTYGTPFSLSGPELAELVAQAQQAHPAMEGVYFNDDDFLLTPARGLEIWRALAEAKRRGDIRPDIRVFGQTRVTNVTETSLREGVAAGLHCIGFGVESFSDCALAAPDLRKDFTAERAYQSVLASLRAGVPVTNINLILFHPSALRSTFLVTVARTVALLRDVLALGSAAPHLSVNAFPYVETYAGTPVGAEAEKNGWPIVCESVRRGDVTYLYPTTLLPRDPHIRAALVGLPLPAAPDPATAGGSVRVLCGPNRDGAGAGATAGGLLPGHYLFATEGPRGDVASPYGPAVDVQRLTRRYTDRLAELQADPRWPAAGTVDRSIGVNAVCLFMGALDLLGLDRVDLAALRDGDEASVRPAPAAAPDGPTILSVASLRALAFDLIGCFHDAPAPALSPAGGAPDQPDDCDRAARALAGCPAHVVFTFTGARWLFRQGNYEVEGVPEPLARTLGRTVQPRDLLIDLSLAGTQGSSSGGGLSLQARLAGALRAALREGSAGHPSPEAEAWGEGEGALCRALRAAGLGATEDITRVLLVAPWGSPAPSGPAGRPPHCSPHWGLEQLAAHLNTACPGADCRVFNPNALAAPALRLAGLLRAEHFDLVGFSLLPHTLPRDAALIDLVGRLSARSVLVGGGMNVERYPLAAWFGATPFDLLVAGPGEGPFARLLACYRDIRHQGPEGAEGPLMRARRAGMTCLTATREEPRQAAPAKERLLAALAGIPNLICRGHLPAQAPRVVGPAEGEPPVEPVSMAALVGHHLHPGRVDLTHGARFGQQAAAQYGPRAIPYETVGRARLYINTSDRCKAHCIFCSAPRYKTRPTPPAEVVRAIEAACSQATPPQGAADGEGCPYDSVHFSDNDLLFDPAYVEALCTAIEEAPPRVGRLPKIAKARTGLLSGPWPACPCLPVHVHRVRLTRSPLPPFPRMTAMALLAGGSAAVDEAAPALLRRLAGAGFRAITFGVESFDDDVLRAMRKGATAAQNRAALEAALAAGLRPGMDMLFFSPWETPATMGRTLRACLRYACRGAAVTVTPLMYTQLGDAYSTESMMAGGADAIEVDEIPFRSVGATLALPRRVRLTGPMEALRDRVMGRLGRLTTALGGHPAIAATHGPSFLSLATQGLLFCYAAACELVKGPPAEAAGAADQRAAAPEIATAETAGDLAVLGSRLTGEAPSSEELAKAAAAAAAEDVAVVGSGCSHAPCQLNPGLCCLEQMAHRIAPLVLRRIWDAEKAPAC
ncbi:hypothetical protein PAPYR_3461 [Paratrimastix pyriformis]|uniref:B12-binding domain-containing protein n=1 Tax=Paratrimastix pyriformis TaxID=342808 RepID=A0ABQ8UQ61_9EUKA|nr:hypothetical protein PAPYR_3461 [Paratrimastix pyriformis]